MKTGVSSLENPLVQTFLRGKLGEVLFNQRHFGVALWAESTGTYRVNNRYAQILGYNDVASLRAEGFNGRAHGDDKALYEEYLDALVHGYRIAFTMELRLRQADGTYGDAVFSATKVTEEYLPEPVVVFVLEKLVKL